MFQIVTYVLHFSVRPIRKPGVLIKSIKLDLTLYQIGPVFHLTNDDNVFTLRNYTRGSAVRLLNSQNFIGARHEKYIQ
jgi:hypothetical protein